MVFRRFFDRGTKAADESAPQQIADSETETAEDAASHGDDIVLGAPNVVRGGSHTGWIDATEMIALGSDIRQRLSLRKETR